MSFTNSRRVLRVSRTDSPADRIIAQIEHLAETVLKDLDPMLDLFERESACVGSLDLDLDTIAVAAGFAKQTVAAISREPGTDRDIALTPASADDRRKQMSRSSSAAVISTMPSSSPCRTSSITPGTPKCSSSTHSASMRTLTSAANYELRAGKCVADSTSFRLLEALRVSNMPGDSRRSHSTARRSHLRCPK